MTCEELQTFLHGYVDGELDLVSSLDIEHHLQGCAPCSAALTRHQALREAFREPTLYYRAPAALRQRLRSAVHQAAGPAPARPRLAWRPLAIAASLAFVALLAWSVVRLRSLPSGEDLLAQDVVSSHVRSLIAGPDVLVESSNQHTVKPWFNGKVDFAPDVKNFAAEGYVLKGGRLDYLDNRKAAALVYRRHDHIINLFIWLAPDSPDAPARELTRQGYHLFHWTRAGLTYWAVSDLNASELREFVGLLQR